MKKRFALLLSICMLLGTLLTACGGGKNTADERIVGNWTLTELSAEGMTINPASYGMNMTFDFKDNGKVTFTMDKDSETGKWSVDGDTITIYDSKNEVSTTIAEDKLVFTEFPGLDGYTITLEKDK